MASRTGRNACRREFVAQLDAVLPPSVFRGRPRHGNARWQPRPLVWVSVAMFWLPCKSLEERFSSARRPKTCLNEQSWRVVSYWLLQRLAVGCPTAAGQNPHRFSAAKARRAVREVFELLQQGGRGPSLTTCRRESTQDSYRRRGPKASRDWPRQKNDRPPQPPKTRPAQPAEIAKAKQLGFVVHLVS